MQNVQKIVDENGYQFFSCYKCGELISAIELAYALNTTGIGCRCGSMKVQPTQVKLAQYSLRNVVEMAIYLKIDEKDYLSDFEMEAAQLNWTEGQEVEAKSEIRKHFKELLALCN